MIAGQTIEESTKRIFVFISILILLHQACLFFYGTSMRWALLMRLAFWIWSDRLWIPFVICIGRKDMGMEDSLLGLPVTWCLGLLPFFFNFFKRMAARNACRYIFTLSIIWTCVTARHGIYLKGMGDTGSRDRFQWPDRWSDYSLFRQSRCDI